MKNKRLAFLPFWLLAAAWLTAGGWAATPRPILVCTAAGATPALQRATADFIPRAGKAPLLQALKLAGEAGEISAKGSEELLVPKAYDTAAHSHLVVIGLRSQDPLLEKTAGFTASLDEGKREFTSLGIGTLNGDVGWVESDRNPFLHSHRIRSAPEDTVLVKITGTSEAGVLAALAAFEQGMINGVVAAGSFTRPETTLIDRDPSVEPAPFALPQTLEAGSAAAFLAGWNQIPENEYRAVLAVGGAAPSRMWRYKYLAAGILEEKPIIRWFGGVQRKAYGNAVQILEFGSAEEASAAAKRMAETEKAARLPSADGEGWEVPWPVDRSETVDRSYGKTLLVPRAAT